MLQSLSTVMQKQVKDKIEEIHIADPFVIQIHLNKKCSLKCSYCYLRRVKDGYLGLIDLKNLLDYFDPLFKNYKLVLAISLVGGDLFFHPDVYKICQYVYRKESVKHISLLVNTLWHKEAYKIILMLKSKLDAVQVNTDAIESRIKDVKFLKDNNIKTIVKIMLAKNNDIERQIKIVKKLRKINLNILVSIDRFCAQSESEYKNVLSRNDLLNVVEKLKKEFPLFITDDPLVKSFLVKKTNYTDTDNDRGNVMRGCIIPSGGLAVFPSGDIKLCARMPQFETGFNIKNFNLIKYIKAFKYVKNEIKKNCSGCNFEEICDGGCVATSYNLTKKFTNDAQCVKNHF